MRIVLAELSPIVRSSYLSALRGCRDHSATQRTLPSDEPQPHTMEDKQPRTMSQKKSVQPQYSSAAPMEQKQPVFNTITAPGQQSSEANADRAPLGLRGGLDYDHPGTRLLREFDICMFGRHPLTDPN
jgi:hypothetical protein